MPESLKFHFTPVGTPTEADARDNPLAQPTTYVPGVIDALRARFGDALGETVTYANEQTLYVRREALLDVARMLKTEWGFLSLGDIGTLDRFTEAGRFEVFYNLVNMQGRQRLRLKVRLDEDDAVVPSLAGLYQNAGWHEREAWDMMGIRFDGHPDLRRIYLPEDFDYHPARKEFPTLGIPGSLPLPNQQTDGPLQYDPFARAHGTPPKD